MSQCHTNIKNFRKKYNLTKKECAELFEVSENTIGNYENENNNQLIKSYVLVNLKNNNKYKDIPIEYFLGLTPSMEKENIEINADLGLNDNSIKVLKNIIKEDDNLKKQIELFAINCLIEKIDFYKLGKMLILPNYENKKIKSEKLYELYQYYFNEGNYYNIKEFIEKERNNNDFQLNKIFMKFCDNVRNSDDCTKLFENVVMRKYEEENRKYDYMDYYEYDNSIDNSEHSGIDFDEGKQLQDEIIQLRKNEIGV